MSAHREAGHSGCSRKGELYLASVNVASVIVFPLGLGAMLIGISRGQIIAVALAFVAVNSSLVARRLSRRFLYYSRKYPRITRSFNVIASVGTTMLAALICLVLSLLASFAQ